MQLVQGGHVSGWDDPRMPTVSGLRRRGYPAEALVAFVEAAGVAKRENIIEASLLEYCAREELNKTTQRVMVVSDPVKIVITNYPEGKYEVINAVNNPEDPESGEREVLFGKEILIEKEDFKEEAGKKFFRLTIGKEVRLKGAYIILANKIIYNDDQTIKEIQCTYDAKSKSGSGSEQSQRKVKGTLHWVSKTHAFEVEIREYDRLFFEPSPASAKTNEELISMLNKDSMRVLKGYAEPFLKTAISGNKYQFQRKGYFVTDKESTATKLIFNKTVGLRDNWAKKQNN